MTTPSAISDFCSQFNLSFVLFGRAAFADNIRRNRNAGEKRKLAAYNGDHLTGSVLHIIRNKLAVRARIGQELLFVECLYEIERLLGGEAIVLPSCFALS